jgi:dolichyl-phosphate beta-glucosyltransferase
MKLSVIIPAYNEENRISRTLLATDDYLRSWNYEYEIIVVNNNSTDNTAAVVLDLKENHAPNIILAHEFVPGKGAAVKKGVAVAQGDYIIFMDADNATPISEIHNFWPLFDGTTDIVIGSRYTEQSNVLVKQPLYRIMLSRLSNLMIQAVLLPGIKDTQVGFKMLTKPAADKIFKNMYTNGWGLTLKY